MSEIKLNLSEEGLFIDNELCLDNKISVIFGKNGTGKSTLTELFRNQITNYDIHIFQGFEGVVGDNKRLNAVVLGEENNEIEKEIEIKKMEIANKNAEIIRIETNTLEDGNNPDNLWSRHQKKQLEFSAQDVKMKSFFTSSAAKIKNKSNPQISGPNYNKVNFEGEISKAASLLPDEIDVLKKTINTSVRKAKELKEPVIDLKAILDLANELLKKKVAQYVVIEEFEGNKEKESFAEQGLRLHKAGDKCAFCGNQITSNRESLLRTFFSAEEIESFRSELSDFIKKIDEIKINIESLSIDRNSFYPKHDKEVLDINNELSNQKNSLIEFLLNIRKEINEKFKSLSESSPALEIELPVGFSKCIKEYNELVILNNESNLESQQEKAKDELRFHEIKTILDEFGYDVEKSKLKSLRSALSQIKEDLDKENTKIEAIGEEIRKAEQEVANLRDKTKNEEKLALNISQVLKLYVPFQLIHVKDEEGKGYYRIKCNRTLSERDINKLSTGEKNIIAFLYFMEKLFEVTEEVQIPKLIVFDDPMNSNDDTMQYVIIEELQKLFTLVKNEEKLVLLTHNSHFYLNVKYALDNYKKNTFTHLISDGNNVKINKITDKKYDFKTNYESLWKELKFLYNAPDANDSMLLNPIRRIIETYSKFNVKNKRDMLSNVVGAEKLLNVNSHSIDDLEAELNGKDKETIINMFKECFLRIGAEQHFNQHWES